MEEKELKKEELIRAFICIEMPDLVIKEVARVQEVLENQKFEGKMTELENLHLTLKFLGELDEENLEKIKKNLKEVRFDKFEVKLSDIGTFNYKGNPRIVWIKIGGKGIFELQDKIDKEMKELGFKMEERFMSHMTIARIKYVKDKKRFIDYIKNIGIKEIGFGVSSFKLMKSELKETGPIYKVLEEYKQAN